MRREKKSVAAPKSGKSSKNQMGMVKGNYPSRYKEEKTNNKTMPAEKPSYPSRY